MRRNDVRRRVKLLSKQIGVWVTTTAAALGIAYLTGSLTAWDFSVREWGIIAYIVAAVIWVIVMTIGGIMAMAVNQILRNAD